MRTRTGIAAALLSLSLIASGCGGDDDAADIKTSTSEKDSSSDSKSSTTAEDTSTEDTKSDDTKSDDTKSDDTSSDDTIPANFEDLSIKEMAKIAEMDEGCFATSLIVGGAMAIGTEGFDESLLDEAKTLVPDEIADEAKVMSEMIANSVGADGQVDFQKVMELSQNSEVSKAGEAVSAWFDANCDTAG